MERTSKSEKFPGIVELTPAEIELIRIKREEEKLAADKKEAERKAYEEKQIVAAKAQIEKDLKSQQTLNQAVETLYAELKILDKNYIVFEKEITKEYRKAHYIPQEEREAKGGIEEEVYFLQHQLLNCKYIGYNNSRLTITPQHYSVDTSRSRFHSNMVYKGVRFYLQLPGIYDRRNNDLKSAKTINEKVQNKLLSDKRKIEETQTKMKGITWLIKELTEMYPNATITEQQYSGSYTYSSRNPHYIEGAKYVKVKFQNGFELQYNWKSTEKDEMILVLEGIVTGFLSAEDKQKVIDLFSK